MALSIISSYRISWRWPLAVFFFLCAFIGLQMGVSLTERPDVINADFLTKAYYSLGLFVMGGMDLGTPIEGPKLGRFLLWLGYFGAPILTASTLIEALIKTLFPHDWKLRRIKNHIVIVGSGELTISYLKALRHNRSKIPVIVIDNLIDPLRKDELRQRFNVRVINGDITHSYFLKRLRLHRVCKVLFLGTDNFQSYEAANKILKLVPTLENRIIIHCSSIRFMRSMENSQVAQKTINFNSYQIAASGLVKQHLIHHFQKTQPKDVVVLAGLGLFGQSVLEELQLNAQQEISTIAIIDLDAERRIQVIDEQLDLANFCRREIFEGNISHPQVWKQVQYSIDFDKSEPVIIFGTGSAEENLRSALWLRSKYPNAMIIARSNQASDFAKEVAEEHNIISISIAQLFEENIPEEWVNR